VQTVQILINGEKMQIVGEGPTTYWKDVYFAPRSYILTRDGATTGSCLRMTKRWRYYQLVKHNAVHGNEQFTPSNINNIPLTKNIARNKK